MICTIKMQGGIDWSAARRRAALGKNPPDSELIDCYDKAISEAIEKGILVDYLSRKATEVRNMFFGEYDYDLDMEAKKEDGIIEGREQKAVETARNLLAMNVLTPEQIAQGVGLPLDQVLALQKELAPTQ